MSAVRILVVPGSIRTGSFNTRLAAVAAKQFALAGVDVTRLSLADYPLPLYDADLEAQSGLPAAAVDLKRQFGAHQGVLLVTPEYNASVPPLLKNAIDWISRVRERGEPPLEVFRDRAYAIASASDAPFGGLRALMALRQILTLGCGATVIAQQFALSGASHAFDDDDRLMQSHDSEGLAAVVRQLIDFAQAMSEGR
jgi:chromate reductase, NAD(P)H dehydrogenase (quinone)